MQGMADVQKVHRAPLAQVIEVIEVKFPRGKGVDGDPVRQVTAYYALTGEFLAEHDSWTPPNEDPA